MEDKYKAMKGMGKIAFPNIFVMTNPPIKPGETWDIKKSEINQLAVYYDNLLNLKGMLMDSALSIESLIDSLILKAFFHEESISNKTKNIFKTEVLQKEFFTFFQKWKTLKSLSKISEFFKEKDISDLLREIHKVIEIRNRFAHGRIYFKESQYPTLEYYSEGKKMEKDLCDDYFKELIELFDEAHKELTELNGVKLIK